MVRSSLLQQELFFFFRWIKNGPESLLVRVDPVKMGFPEHKAKACKTNQKRASPRCMRTEACGDTLPLWLRAGRAYLRSSKAQPQEGHVSAKCN